MKTFHAKDFGSALEFMMSGHTAISSLPVEINLGDGSTITVTKENVYGIQLGCLMASSWPKNAHFPVDSQVTE